MHFVIHTLLNRNMEFLLMIGFLTSNYFQMAYDILDLDKYVSYMEHRTINMHTHVHTSNLFLSHQWLD